MQARTPEWVKDAVFYQIFPERFARSERMQHRRPSGLESWDSEPTRFGYKGGDLYGVAENMDYLKRLGITAIYFNPIFQSASNHRYHTQDYYRVDPILGGDEAFEEMLAAAHERGIKVVLDGVFNHSSRGFYEFQQTMENGSSSPYLDWFYFDHETLAPGVGPDAYPEPRLHREQLRGAGQENGEASGTTGAGQTGDSSAPAGDSSSQAGAPDDHPNAASSQAGAPDDHPNAASGQAGAPDDHPKAASLENDTGLTIRDGGSKDRYGYHAWWDIPALPKFNTDTPAVREFLLSVAEYWVQRGIDGWRLDVPEEIDDDAFWREFRRRVKAVNPDAYIVGEIWTYAERWLSGDQFDAVMNYVFNRLCYRFFGGRTIDPEHDSPGGHKLEPADAERFEAEFEELRTRYPEEITRAQLNLLSSHDEPRFLTVVSEDKSAFRLATAFQMTIEGAPCIYYGDEIGMTGGSDPECRRTFPEDRSSFDEDLLEYIRELISLRHRCEALRRGSHHTLIARGSVYGFLRSHPESWAVVLFNAGDSEWRGEIDVSEVLAALPGDAKRPAYSTHEAVFGSGSFTFESGVFIGFSLGPRQAAVFAG